VTLALDTNVLIELVRGKSPATRRQFDDAETAGLSMVTSLVVLHELLLGCELHHDPAQERLRVRKVLEDVIVEPLDESDVSVAARLQANLRRKGWAIGSLDSLIAGQALARDWTLVTVNTREFGRIAGLKIIDWTAS
jgi:tRNA(fMet)-specific endonuclease VapC